MMPLLPSLVTVLAIALYFGLTVNVSRARLAYKVPAPKMTGNESFERILRAQQNMLESLVVFLPCLWIFAGQVSETLAAAFGIIWLVGRVLYTFGYYKSAKSRLLGFFVGALVSFCLILGSLAGLLLALA